MELLNTLNSIVGILFMLCYSYQIVYVIVVLVRKPRSFRTRRSTGMQCSSRRAMSRR